MGTTEERIEILKDSKTLIELPPEMNGAPFTGAYEVCIVLAGAARSGWQTPDVAGTDKGILIGPGSARGVLAPGTYRCFGRIPSTPEIPVFPFRNLITIT